ncbi:MAG: hypothetical protein JXA52_05265 [Planctomycetes bacterium]|nr:hypothetical protein [Planctomycetota bacterium]
MPKDNPFEAFIEAQRKTRILRTRKNLLYTFGSTRLPYVFLANSGINRGDVVMRKGEVSVDRPKIFTPSNPVELEGFGFEELEEGMIPVLLNRWVHFPPAKYHNSSSALEVLDGPFERAQEEIINRLDRQNDIRTGVIQGLEHLWGFSVLGYVGQMIVRSTPSNIGEYFEHYGLNNPEE